MTFHIEGSSTSEIEAIVANYRSQRDQGRIKSTFIALENYKLGPNDGLVCSMNDDGLFEGALHYVRLRGIPSQSLPAELRKHFRDLTDGDFNEVSDVSAYSGFNQYQGNGDIVVLSGMESFKLKTSDETEPFQRRPGVGKELVSHLSNLKGIELIVVDPVKGAVGFYEKAGFNKSDLYSGPERMMFLHKIT